MASIVHSLEDVMDQHQTALAAALRRGDPDVLEELIERYKHRLLRYLLSITGHRQTAEDLFQETWIRVLERGHQYRGGWKFESWLFSIARHLAIDLARRRKAGSLDELMDPETGHGFDPAAPAPSPLQQLLLDEGGERLALGLARLAPAYREVLVLRFQEQLSLEEIAEITSVPLSTAKSRLYRGVDALRARLERSE